MKRTKEGKQGEVLTSKIVIVILAIFGFLVILYFILSGTYTQDIDRQTCHQSVIYRSSVKIGPVDSSKAIPLNCETEKICFSLSGEDCTELSDAAGNPVRKIRLSSDAGKAKEEILDEIAEELKNCQWMLGEGQLDFMPKDLLQKKYGLICTRFVFDDAAKEQIDNIPISDVFRHLEQKKMNDGKNYLEYLYPGFTDYRDSIAIHQFLQSEDGSLKPVDPKNFGIDIEFERGYAIIAVMGESSTWQTWAKAIGAAAVLPAAIGVVAYLGVPVGIILITSGGTISATSFVAGSYAFVYTYPDKYSYVPPTIYPFDPQELKKKEIFSFEIAP
ncbi:MAG: hypothetical protein RL557_530 [archaeon]|jgi:hypothetical protein